MFQSCKRILAAANGHRVMRTRDRYFIDILISAINPSWAGGVAHTHVNVDAFKDAIAILEKLHVLAPPSAN